MVGAFVSTGFAQAVRQPQDRLIRPNRSVSSCHSRPAAPSHHRASDCAAGSPRSSATSFIVDNRPGGGSSIGAELAARANPDGYTVIVVASSYAANAAIYKLPYDPVTGIAPVTLITTGLFVAAVSPSLKATNLKEFIELCARETRDH